MSESFLAVWLQAPKFGKDYPQLPQSVVSYVFIAVIVVLMAVGFVWAMTLIIRTLLGKPED